MSLSNPIKILLCAIICTFALENVAYAQVVNLAPAGIATQSSTRPAGGAASRGNDGNIDGQFFNGSVTHTRNQAQPWWQVDLGSISDLTTINLFNRTDCCANRGRNYHVFVSDVPFTGTTVADSQAQAGVLDLFDPGTIGRPTTLAINRTGRYVRVQKSTRGILSLAEVQVFGTRLPEINILSSESGAVADGGTDAQGAEPAGTAKTVTYTINNTGAGTLNLTGTPTATNLTNVAAPVITAPASATVAPGAATTFTVTYTPTLTGAFSFELDIASDDADENPYDVTVSGTATDTEAPVFAGVPANIIQSTDAGLSTAVVTFTAPTATDNLDGAITPVLVSSPTAGLTSGSAFPVGVTTLTYTATDAAGNTSMASFTVTVRDTEPPVFTGGPTNIKQTVDAGLNTAVVTFTAPTATDNVDGAITPVLTSSPTAGLVSGSAFPVGVTTLTFTITDSANNAAATSFTITITVTDDDGPVFAGVPTDIIQTTDPGLNTAVVTFTDPTATDAVDGAVTPVLVSSPTAGLASGSAFPLGVTTLTYTATDTAGNATGASFTVTVTDGEAPVFAGVPTDIVQATDAGLNTAVVTFTDPTATDNVDGAITPVLVSSPTAGLTSGSAFPLGVTTLTYTATDAQGNPQTASFTVTVNDTESPVFTTFPSDITLSVDFPATTAVANWTQPTATDNAPGTVVITQTAGPVSSLAFPMGTTTVTYTATDAAGNVTTQSFIVTVTAAPPGTVTFVVNSNADGVFDIQSAEPALNTPVVVNAGSGTSALISLRPGSFPITFTAPDGVGVESTQCNPVTSTLNAGSRSGTIVIASGVAVTCTITVRDSLKATVAQIGQLLKTRSQLILQHQPDLTRRINRLEGRYTNNGGVSGFGITLKNDRIPFSAQIGTDDISFNYSMLQSRAAGTGTVLVADATSVLGSFGITPSNEDRDASALFPTRPTTTVAGTTPTSTNVFSKSSLNSADASKDLSFDEQNSDAPKVFPFDVWAEGRISRFKTGDAKGNFGIFHIGADYLIRPDVLLGFSAQGDWTSLDGENTASKTEGFGFLLTPYVVAKLLEGFYFDARAGWGQADNDISPFGTYTDSFDSERWMASAALIGMWQLDDSLKITPEARLSYFKETSDAYVDSLSVSIPSVEVETGIFEFGPTSRKDFTTDGGLIYSPFLGVKGIWTFSQKNTAASFINQLNLADEGVRARLEAGINIHSFNGGQVNLSANYDGIGDSDFSSWGLKFAFDYKF